MPAWLTRPVRLRIASLCCGVAGVVAGLAALVLSPFDPTPFLASPHSTVLTDHVGKPLHVFLSEAEQWSLPLEVAEATLIETPIARATMAAEDQHFLWHPGVDPVAVLRAAWQNLRRGGVVSGASTITMQVVKLSGQPSASWTGKVHQAVQALALERHASKPAIISAYLSKAPYGMNLVGCEAAARRYFGCRARELTVPQAALLAGLPKAPARYQPFNNPAEAVMRRNYVLKRMWQDGYIDAVEYERGCAAALGVRWNDWPRAAPHVAARLWHERALSRGRTVSTTLDLELQDGARRALREWLGHFGGAITNGAVMVVHVPTAAVRVWVGSADFFDTPGGGQVDLCRSPRSPGSALKPFAYGCAMAQQRLYATEMLLDGSLDYGRYAPRNFDERYRGLVPAGEALRRSLNVPAITVIERVGERRFRAFLEDAGMTTLTQAPGHYGLGLVVGSCEVRLEELATLYTALARNGILAPLRLLDSDPGPEETGRVLFEPAIAAGISNELRQLLPDELHRGGTPVAGTQRPVSWKTGTSSDNRDAWAFVFDDAWLVSVWLGNNNNRSSDSLVGARAALPLAGRIFRSLPLSKGGGYEDPPRARSKKVEVCARSGLPASPWCPATKSVSMPAVQYVHRRCAVHTPLGERWPGAARQWDLAAVQSADLAPGVPVARRDTLRIVNPADQAEYVAFDDGQERRLVVQTNAVSGQRLHWLLNDRYMGCEEGGSTNFSVVLRKGDHQLVCVDENGHSDRVRFTVVDADTAL